MPAVTVHSNSESGSEVQFGGALAGNSFVSAMRAIPVSIAHTDRDLRYTWIYNPHRDPTLDAALGKRLSEVVPSDGSRQVIALKCKVLESGQRIQLDFEADHEDGTHHYHLSIDALYEGSQIVGVSTVTTDLTPTLRAQEARHESEMRAEAILETTVDAVVTIDADGKIHSFNRSAERQPHRQHRVAKMAAH